MDSAADFERKTRAMFGRARRQFHEIGFAFVVEIAEFLVEYTPGFGNQEPEDTEYVPTGRLRGGYRYSAARLETASKWEEGPFSDYGVETVAKLEADMRAAGPKSFYIVNDVAYGYIVWAGMGRHVRPRPFTNDAAAPSTQKVALRNALNRVRGR